jgi:hypothetical protein
MENKTMKWERVKIKKNKNMYFNEECEV